MRIMLFNIVIVFSCLFLHTNLQAQSDLLKDIESRFHTRHLEAPQEKIYVHTDKNFYVAGELIWFKLYQVDASSHIPINISKLTYVEILSTDKKSVLQSKIEMNAGTGDGSFQIPVSVQSGNYIFRAYTNWMKNFGAQVYFEKIITIVNAGRRPDWPFKESASAVTIQFFPEGGNLVNGLQSTIAFHAVNRNGKGIDCAGVIVNNENDTIASFKTQRFGMGRFQLTPQSNHQYKAVINTNGETITVPLAAASEKGLVMHVSDKAAQLNIRVESRGENEAESVYLIVHTKQKIKLAVKKALQSGSTEFDINKELIGDGISHLTIFNNSGQPVCERLYFKKPASLLDIELRSERKEYNKRQKQTLEITTRHKDQLLPANLSLSVYRIDSLSSSKETDIASYLSLTSELKGNIESPAYYLSNEKDIEQATENLLLTHGWRKFDWEQISKDSSSLLKTVPEYEGQVIEAKLLHKTTTEPAVGVQAFLSVPGQRFQFRQAISDKNGMLRFNVGKVYGSNDLVIHTTAKKTGDQYELEFINPYSTAPATHEIPAFELSEKWKDQLLSRSIHTQAQNVYSSDSTGQFMPYEITDTTAFYGLPNSRYWLDDYTRFITMEEVMREYVAEVRVRKLNGKYRYFVKNEPAQDFFEDDPLVLLDGVPVFNIDRLMAFDPLKIKKLEVVTQKHFFGSLFANGIVSYTTYDGDLGGFELDPNAIIIQHQGLQLRRKFYSPVYETDAQLQSRLPDFRTLLFWEPEIHTDTSEKKQLSFYTSDVAGNYVVIVHGLTKDGIAGTGYYSFTVK